MSLLVGLIGLILIGLVIGADILEHVLQALDGLLDEGLVVLGDGATALDVGDLGLLVAGNGHH